MKNFATTTPLKAFGGDPQDGSLQALVDAMVLAGRANHNRSATHDPPLLSRSRYSAGGTSIVTGQAFADLRTEKATVSGQMHERLPVFHLAATQEKTEARPRRYIEDRPCGPLGYNSPVATANLGSKAGWPCLLRPAIPAPDVSRTGAEQPRDRQREDSHLSNPYSDLPASAFWRSAVAEPEPLAIRGLWKPKFMIRKPAGVSTYGSCFAQHIGRALASRGYNWLNTEVAPRGVSDETAKAYNYGIFTSRTANIYTTTLLLQWARWAFDGADVPDEVWEADGRFFDPFRPTIEPNGFASREELLRMRQVVLRAFRRSVTEARFFVFTLGLTERWINSAAGYEYPLCPGTAGGRFDPSLHVFDNLNFASTIEALRGAMSLFKKANPGLRFILTVSPVPLTATASGQHVLTATTHSKSILRAVAGRLAETRKDTDYFPSYEIITSPVFRGGFFAPNLRSVTTEGVNFVMDSFFRDLAA